MGELTTLNYASVLEKIYLQTIVLDEETSYQHN